MKIHLEVQESSTDASFFLLAQVRSATGEPKATIGRLDPTDPDLADKLKLMVQAYRIGRKLALED